jgi:hypothetical protein
MRHSVLLTAVAASLAIAAAPAAAANIIADVDQVAAALKRGGYTVEIKQTKDGRFIRSTRGKENYEFSVFFYGCDANTTNNCKSVQLYAGFSPKTKPTLEALNEYASENRWGRVYRDDEGDPVVEMDIDLEKGGMSEALFLDNLEYFEAVMERFGEYVFKGKAGT